MLRSQAGEGLSHERTKGKENESRTSQMTGLETKSNNFIGRMSRRVKTNTFYTLRLSMIETDRGFLHQRGRDERGS